jgi:hypothetical protein
MSAAPPTAALPNHPGPLRDRVAGPAAGSAAGGATAERRGDARTHPQGSAPTHIRGDTPTHSRGDTPAQSHSGTAAHAPADRLLSLLRKLIEYGQDLARTVQQRAAAATLFTVAVHFGTRDMALILARITRGLRLAAALEARLVSRPARLGSAAAPVRQPAHVPADTPADGAPDDHAPADHSPADPAKRPARRAGTRPNLPDVPTAEEIAAALRHRPAAAVIADICRDLGIVPAHPLWDEVMKVLCGHGGNVMTFFKDTMARLFRSLAAAVMTDADGWPAPPRAALVCGTGPP